MKVYLAARYGRREELAGYARELRAEGIEVTSSWHDRLGLPDDSPDRPMPRQAHEARRDFGDIRAADVFVLFAEHPGVDGSGRGGRMVELGYCLALNEFTELRRSRGEAGVKPKPILIVGAVENVFCALATTWVPDWPALREALRARTWEVATRA